jgi:hypothetical protein
MQGLHDQITEQYDALVAQTQSEPTTSLWLSSDEVPPSNADNWLGFGGFTDETRTASKGLLFISIRKCIFVFSDKPENNSSDIRQSISSTTESGI